MQAKAKVKKRARRAALMVSEIAQGLGVSPWLVYQKITEGEVPHVRIGRSVLVPLREARRLWPGVFDNLDEVLIESEAKVEGSPDH